MANPTERTLIDAAQEHLAKPASAPTAHEHVMLISDPKNFVTRVEDLERFAARPRRLAQTVTHETPASFVDYVRAYASEKTTRLFASLDARRVVAVMDYHDNEPTPSWCEHRAVYPAELDDSFAGWHALHDKPIPQRAFARFLEDRADDVVIPAPADIMEVAGRFDALRSVTFKSAVNLATGEREFQYETKDSTKGSVSVPKLLKVRTPVFYGCDPVEWVARFSYDISEGVLSFKVAIHRLPQLLDQEFQRLVDRLAVDLPGLPLHRGAMA